MKNRIRQGGAAIALIIFVSLFGTVIRAVARAGPLIQTSTVTPSPSPSNTPSPSPSETPSQTPTETPKPTNTLSPGEWVSARTVINRCMYYKDLVTFWIELEPPEYENITVEHVPLILAIMAEESGCDKNVDASHAHAIGIMQIVPKPWTSREECLKRPSCNIYNGIYILDCAVNNANGDFRKALAYYNCSEANVNKQLTGEDLYACGDRGGIFYSERIHKFWLPLIIEKLEETQ